MKKKTSAASKVILTLTLLFFYLPILYIIVFSFNDSRSLTKFGGFSLRWYEKMFADSTMMEAVLYTVVIAILATVVSTIVGTVTAIGLSKSKKVLQAMVERVNDLPVMNPDIVTGISLLMFFSVLAVKMCIRDRIGTPTEIYRYPVNEFVANFIGETNIIDGVMQGDDLVVFEDKKFPCRARGFNKNEKVDVVIRPEHLDIVPRAEGMLKGVVKSQLFKGMHYDTVVETRVGTTITVKMQVSQDRPVLNADAGEKISASAFLIDVEDVGELDDAKVVALASAEAWDAETEEPISIKNVEYDLSLIHI